VATTAQIQSKLADLYTKRAGIEKKMGEAQVKKAKALLYQRVTAPIACQSRNHQW